MKSYTFEMMLDTGLAVLWAAMGFYLAVHDGNVVGFIACFAMCNASLNRMAIRSLGNKVESMEAKR